MTHKLYINAYFIVSIMLSPIQELEPGATPCRGGRSAAAILADRSIRKTKNT